LGGRSLGVAGGPPPPDEGAEPCEATEERQLGVRCWSVFCAAQFK